MHSLSKSSQGSTYTIKWMFGLPEVMKAMNDMDIHEGSTIRVLQKFHDSLIILPLIENRSGKRSCRQNTSIKK